MPNLLFFPTNCIRAFVLVALVCAAFSLQAQQFYAHQKLMPPGLDAQDIYGWSLAADSNVVVVGAINDDDSLQMPNRGAVYVWTWTGVTYTLQKLIASDATSYARFGSCVDIDGNRMVIGASGVDTGGTSDNIGAAYVFEFNGTQWQETAKLMASDGESEDFFGNAVALEGDLIVVGAEGAEGSGNPPDSTAGAAYIFEHDGTNWNETLITPQIQNLNNYFGKAVEIANNRVFVGAPGWDDNGDVHLFEHNGTTWVETHHFDHQNSIPFPADQFGWSLSAEGDRLVVGAFNYSPVPNEGHGAAFVYDWDGTTWNETQLPVTGLEDMDRFGAGVALSGDRILVGAEHNSDYGQNQGAVYNFEYDGTNWVWDGVPIYAQNTVDWASFGEEIAFAGDQAYIAARLDDNQFGPSAGTVYRLEELPNLVTGRVYLDENADGSWQSNEPTLPNTLIYNSLFTSPMTTSDSLGLYTTGAQEMGSITVSAAAPYNVQQTQPTGSGVYVENFPGPGPDTLTGRDFGFAPLQVNDLAVYLTPLGVPTPGFQMPYHVDVINKGWSPRVNVNLKVVLDSLYVLDSTSLNYTQGTGDTLLFSLPDTLHPQEHFSFMIYGAVDINASPFGQDTLHSTAQVFPMTGDALLVDNTSSLEQATIGAYDPNDKMIMNSLPGQPNLLDTADTRVEYRIRFQNTGLAPATFVVIADTLEAYFPDPQAIELLSASHPYSFQLYPIPNQNRSVLVWRFDDIQLPDSASDPLGSIGFIRFALQRDAAMQPGDTVRNQAAIYFDYNPPIFTPVSEGVLASPLTSRAAAPAQAAHQLYPNPTRGELTVSGRFEAHQPGTLQVFDPQGRQLQTHTLSGTNPQLQLELPAGLYLIRITHQNAGTWHRVVLH